jgi:hypothetical protein
LRLAQTYKIFEAEEDDDEQDRRRANPESQVDSRGEPPRRQADAEKTDEDDENFKEIGQVQHGGASTG